MDNLTFCSIFSQVKEDNQEIASMERKYVNLPCCYLLGLDFIQYRKLNREGEGRRQQELVQSLAH